MIKLNDDLFIGEGYHKKTYFNPKNPNTCIKILQKDNQEALHQLTREVKHNKNLQQKNPDLKGVAKFLGMVETNLGLGYEFELVKDEDTGEISESLEAYLKRGAWLVDDGAELLAMLQKLKSDMIKYGIIPMEMYAANILCKKYSSNRYKELIIIDDIGTASLIPIEYYFSFAAKKRIERRFKRMADRFLQISDHEIIKKVINSL